MVRFPHFSNKWTLIRSLLLFFMININGSLLWSLSEDVIVSSQIDQNQGLAGQPLKGTVTVTHKANLSVNDTGFKINGKPLAVKKIKEIPVGSSTKNSTNLTIAIYSFQLEEQPPGLYILPSISVTVGGTVYQSNPTSYQIKSATKSETESPKASKLPDKDVFILQTFIDGPTPLYPGQRANLIYRIFFNRSVQISLEHLPLLDPAPQGFIKIGETVIQTAQEDQLSLQQISQEVEAKAPGIYHFDPSVIEGYIYTEDSEKNRSYEKSKLHAEAPEVTLNIQPFPKENQPASFNGAVGQFNFKVQMTTPSAITIGDDIQLDLTITGSGNLASLLLPDIFCQPEFSGFFREEGLTPAGEIVDNAKHFHIQIRPITNFINQVPSIEFSYFDPSTTKYHRLRSSPISLSVSNLNLEKQKPLNTKEQSYPNEVSWREINKTIPPKVNLDLYPLTKKDLSSDLFGKSWVLYLIPIGIWLWLWQKKIYNNLKKIPTETKNSQDYFNEALQANNNPHLFYPLLSHAFTLKLFESHMINSSDLTSEELPKEGLVGEIKLFLIELEQKRFTGKMDLPTNSLISKAKELFGKLTCS